MVHFSSLRSSCAELLGESHPPARLFLGLTCLGVGLATTSMLKAVFLLSGVIVFLYIIGTPVAIIFKALRILIFLVVPILILHMWLTPGRLLFDFGEFGHISVEGLQKGAWLSLHLLLMYFSAMLFSRLITLREWMALTAICGGRRIQAYVILMSPLSRQVRWRMQSLSQGRRQRGTWREFAPTLAAVVNQSMSVASMLADSLWLRWPDHAGILEFISPAGTTAKAWPATLLFVLISIGILVLMFSR